MKAVGFALSFAIIAVAIPAQADLTIVQKVEGAGPPTEMTIKIKGEKARIDASPQVTTIVNGKTGEMVNLMRDEKKIVRISADKMKAAVEMINRYESKGKKSDNVKPKLIATGQKEKIN